MVSVLVFFDGEGSLAPVRFGSQQLATQGETCARLLQQHFGDKLEVALGDDWAPLGPDSLEWAMLQAMEGQEDAQEYILKVRDAPADVAVETEAEATDEAMGTDDSMDAEPVDRDEPLEADDGLALAIRLAVEMKLQDNPPSEACLEMLQRELTRGTLPATEVVLSVLKQVRPAALPRVAADVAESAARADAALGQLVKDFAEGDWQQLRPAVDAMRGVLERSMACGNVQELVDLLADAIGSYSSHQNCTSFEEVHLSIVCDQCDAHPILGPRYKCACCRDYDLCARCYARDPTHPGEGPCGEPRHHFTRVRSRQQAEVVGFFEEIHPTVTCDGCDAYPVLGPRWKCDNLPDFDFCAACYQQWTRQGGHVEVPPTATFTRIHGDRNGTQDGPCDVRGDRPSLICVCDRCDEVISGTRYKCDVCPGFDLCGRCFELDTTHPGEGQTGLPRHTFTRCDLDNAPSAETVPDLCSSSSCSELPSAGPADDESQSEREPLLGGESELRGPEIIRMDDDDSSSEQETPPSTPIRRTTFIRRLARLRAKRGKIAAKRISVQQRAERRQEEREQEIRRRQQQMLERKLENMYAKEVTKVASQLAPLDAKDQMLAEKIAELEVRLQPEEESEDDWERVDAASSKPTCSLVGVVDLDGAPLGGATDALAPILAAFGLHEAYDLGEARRLDASVLLLNDGEAAWLPGTALRCVAGDPMGLPELELVAGPQEMIEVRFAVEAAEAEPGDSYWTLTAPSGEPFGPLFVLHR